MNSAWLHLQEESKVVRVTGAACRTVVAGASGGTGNCWAVGVASVTQGETVVETSCSSPRSHLASVFPTFLSWLVSHVGGLPQVSGSPQLSLCILE